MAMVRQEFVVEPGFIAPDWTPQKSESTYMRLILTEIRSSIRTVMKENKEFWLKEFCSDGKVDFKRARILKKDIQEKVKNVVFQNLKDVITDV